MYMIQVIELGPFGSRIKRGIIKSLDEIPEGYEIKYVDYEDSLSKVYIEPHTKQDL